MSKWFVHGNEIGIQESRNTIFIFPYAGGGASSFKNWGRHFKNSGVYFAQYPGRENRFSEKAIKDIRELVEELFKAMKTVFDFTSPYYLFGHSMGTKIVYELALKIKESGLPNPEGLIISAIETWGELSRELGQSKIIQPYKKNAIKINDLKGGKNE